MYIPWPTNLPICRSFILMSFHPSVTDTMGALHLARQFLITLDRILEEDSSGSAPDSQPGAGNPT